MERRTYRLGRRQESTDRTRAAILGAARDVLIGVSGSGVFNIGAVAVRAGVSRITVYNQFGSRAGLLRALADGARRGPAADSGPPEPRERLRQRIAGSSAVWASDPELFRSLPDVGSVESTMSASDRMIAEGLAASDQLRPGCSLKEAEDVIGALTSFPTFDRLHRGGRRSQAAVADILMRLAGAFLA